MTTRNVRDYSKRGDAIPVPNLTRVQQDAYTRFLQKDLVHEERKTHLGLQSLLREVFPIESSGILLSLRIMLTWTGLDTVDFRCDCSVDVDACLKCGDHRRIICQMRKDAKFDL